MAITVRQSLAKTYGLPDNAEWAEIEEQMRIARKIEKGSENCEQDMQAMDEKINIVVARSDQEIEITYTFSDE